MLVLNGRNTQRNIITRYVQAIQGITGVTHNSTWTLWFWFNAFTDSPCSFDPDEADPVKRNLLYEIKTPGLAVFQEATGSGNWKLVVEKRGTGLLVEQDGLSTDRWYCFTIRCNGSDITIQSFQHDANPDEVTTTGTGVAFINNDFGPMRTGTDAVDADARGLLAYVGYVPFFLEDLMVRRMRPGDAPSLHEMREVCSWSPFSALHSLNDEQGDVIDFRSPGGIWDPHASRPPVFVQNNTTDGDTVLTPGTEAAWFNIRPKDYVGWDGLDAGILTGIPGVSEVWINDHLPTMDDPLVGLVNGTPMFPAHNVEVTNQAGPFLIKTRPRYSSGDPTEGLDVDMLRALFDEFPEAWDGMNTPPENRSEVRLGNAVMNEDTEMVRGIFSNGGDPQGYWIQHSMGLRTMGPCPALLRPWTQSHTMIFVYSFVPRGTPYSMAFGVWDEWVLQGYGSQEATTYKDPDFPWRADGKTLIDAGMGRSGSIWVNEGSSGNRIRGHYSSHGGGGSVGPSGDPKVPNWLYSQQIGRAGNMEMNRKISVAAVTYNLQTNTIKCYSDGRFAEIGNGVAASSNPWKIPGDDLYHAFASPFRLFSNLGWATVGSTHPGNGAGFRGAAWAEVFVGREMSAAEIRGLTDDITQFSGGGPGSLENFSDVDTFRKIQTS